MRKNNSQLVLREDDYSLLISYLNSEQGKAIFDPGNVENLKSELKKARLVSKEDFPPDVIRLDSTVRIKAEGKDEVIELMLVTPEKANIKEKKVSVMAPVGTALIGFRKGQKVNWRVPAGERTFSILDVINAE